MHDCGSIGAHVCVKCIHKNRRVGEKDASAMGWFDTFEGNNKNTSRRKKYTFPGAYRMPIPNELTEKSKQKTTIVGLIFSTNRNTFHTAA